MSIIHKITSIVSHEKDVILCYSGYFFIDFLTLFGRKLRLITKVNYFASIKLFKIFMELAQNISLYSEHRIRIDEELTVGFGSFTLNESPDNYIVSASNFVKNEDAVILKERCENINSMEKPELRALKRDQRRKADGYKIGARVGLIQIAILAGNKLEVEIQAHDNNLSIFTISTLVDKY